MAEFSITDIPGTTKVGPQWIHNEYQTMIQSAIYRAAGRFSSSVPSVTALPGLRYYDLPVASSSGSLDARNRMLGAGQKLITLHDVEAEWDSKQCVKAKVWGLGWFGIKKIAIAPIKPEVIRFKYQQWLPPETMIPQTVIHELTHTLSGHDELPKKIQELECHAAAYLFGLLCGVSYRNREMNQIPTYFRSGVRLWEAALTHENRIINNVLRLAREAEVHIP